MRTALGDRFNSRSSGTFDARPTRALGIAVTCAAITATLLAVRAAATVRRFEAATAAQLIRHSGIGRAFWMHGDRFVLAVRRPQIITIAPACSALFLCLPVGAVGALLATGRAGRVTNAVVATLIGCATLFAVNQLRFLTIAVCVWILGDTTGFQFGQLILGTALSLLGIAIVTFAIVAVVHRTRHRGLAV